MIFAFAFVFVFVLLLLGGEIDSRGILESCGCVGGGGKQCTDGGGE